MLSKARFVLALLSCCVTKGRRERRARECVCLSGNAATSVAVSFFVRRVDVSMCRWGFPRGLLCLSGLPDLSGLSGLSWLRPVWYFLSVGTVTTGMGSIVQHVSTSPSTDRGFSRFGPGGQCSVA